MAKANKPGTIKTQRELADAAGISFSGIRKLLYHPDCPIERTGTWSASQVRHFLSWHSTLQEDRSADDYQPQNAAASPARVAEIRLKIERMKKLQIERKILEGHYIERDNVESGWVQRAEFFRQSMEALPADMARKLEGRSAVEIEAILKDSINGIIDSYARKPYPGVAA